MIINTCSLCLGGTEALSDLRCRHVEYIDIVFGCFQLTHASSDDASTRKYSYCTVVVTSYVLLRLCNFFKIDVE